MENSKVTYQDYLQYPFSVTWRGITIFVIIFEEQIYNIAMIFLPTMKKIFILVAWVIAKITGMSIFNKPLKINRRSVSILNKKSCEKWCNASPSFEEERKKEKKKKRKGEIRIRSAYLTKNESIFGLFVSLFICVSNLRAWIAARFRNERVLVTTRTPTDR